MPKNAVHRLQKIENELKTVISIYDVANNSNEDIETLRKKKDPDCCHQQRSEQKKRSNSFMARRKEPITLPFKKIAYLIPAPIEKLSSRRVRHTCSKKPNSAPNSSTMSSTAEVGYLRQHHPPNNSETHSERNFITKIEENLKDSEWIDCNLPLDCELFMSPSRVLETANKVLSENNYHARSDDIGDNKQHPSEITKSYTSRNDDAKNSKTSHSFKKHAKEQLEKGNSESKRNETITNNSMANMKVINAKPSEDENIIKVSNETLESSPTHQAVPNKIPRLEKRFKILAFDFSCQKRPPKTHGEHKESKDRQNRAWSCEKDVKKNKGTNHGRSSSSGEVKCRSQINSNEASTKSKIESKNFKEKLDSESTDDKLDETEQYFDTTDVKEIIKITEPDDSELGAQHLSKIIEKSNEKLQKMKVSKSLALGIAKQLKEKYDEVQLSNKELLDMLKKVEDDNEKLKYAVKDADVSKTKLKLKMEEIRIDSKTMLLEQGMKNKEVIDENDWLKTKMKELEKKHSQEMLGKQKQIDRIQRDMRFLENKKEARQETKEKKDTRILMNEKSDLLRKVEDMESLLSFKQSIMEKLEEKVRELEKELEKQSLELKQKTERLENTNSELESIRQRSKNLEEQVKLLRINIESLDLVHQKMTKRSSDYENDLKTNQEQLKKLKEENVKITGELENERDSLLIKNKIIEDQQETIRQLREKSEEYKTVLKRNQSLERILNVEREEKLELQEAIERLKRRKEDLKQKIQSLENDLLIGPQEVVRDLQKTQMVLHELENQVQIKQKEWELHLNSLIREKEQACSVAEFATKKLMQRTSEFQRLARVNESEAHKRLHRVLAENLAEKNRRRKETNEKMTTQVRQIADNVTPTQEEQLDTKGKQKYIQCMPKYCTSVNDGSFAMNDAQTWMPRRTQTSQYVQCSTKTKNLL